MYELRTLVEGLSAKDNKVAYHSMQQLEAVCANSDAAYSYFDLFVEMLGDANSYIRTRAVVLIAAVAKWDADNKVDEIIDEYLKHIMDEKPITARQCIKALPAIAKYKPDLADDISLALHGASPHIYAGSMQSLVAKDIQAALLEIAGGKGLKNE